MKTSIILKNVNIPITEAKRPKVLGVFFNKVTEAMHHVASRQTIPTSKVPAENFRAYANVENIDLNKLKFRRSRKMEGCGVKGISKPLPAYNGPIERNVGLSTLHGRIGGGWVKGSLNTPLSTPMPYDCAVLNLINEDKQEHILFHVYTGAKTDGSKGTSIEDIEAFINKYFKEFNKVNILLGKNLETRSTVENILYALEKVNPEAEKTFFHIPVNEPEIVAYQGGLSHLGDETRHLVSFAETSNFYMHKGQELTL